MSGLKQMLRAPWVWRARARDRIVAQRDVPTLAVVAIFRDEAPFLDEWLRFHEAVGVGHFYLYNNFSTDHFRDVLAPWIARGLVTLTDWPVECGQLAAYRHAAKTYRMDTKWMAFIDIDEYLFSPIAEKVTRVLENRFDNAPAIGVFSPYFGSSNVEERPQTPIARAFTRRAVLSTISAKTIANPRWIYSIRNAHLFKYWAGTTVDTNGHPLKADQPVLDVLRLNHYWSRSLSDLRDKIARGEVTPTIPRTREWYFNFERKMNAEDDTSILPVLDRVFGKSEDTAKAG
ncbi:glycosyltransferase family 92 protein [Rhodopseudomonas palustris]|uniref:glycosyltransferase family 92 protein n=1 Tax=Rhodopseudomonas palustris TaxID=1076 RepID=UPI0021F3652B|nr:glycosyltransferase family 92 protein [Rhodopseudomonas palustris]UYO52478.1 glycosyltransferase family 92 protein [Rhodopseudomonas palustris]